MRRYTTTSGARIPVQFGNARSLFVFFGDGGKAWKEAIITILSFPAAASAEKQEGDNSEKCGRKRNADGAADYNAVVG